MTPPASPLDVADAVGTGCPAMSQTPAPPTVIHQRKIGASTSATERQRSGVSFGSISWRASAVRSNRKATAATCVRIAATMHVLPPTTSPVRRSAPPIGTDAPSTCAYPESHHAAARSAMATTGSTRIGIVAPPTTSPAFRTSHSASATTTHRQRIPTIQPPGSMAPTGARPPTTPSRPATMAGRPCEPLAEHELDA